MSVPGSTPGECEMAGDNVGGVAVHIGARIAGWRWRCAAINCGCRILRITKSNFATGQNRLDKSCGCSSIRVRAIRTLGKTAAVGIAAGAEFYVRNFKRYATFRWP